MMASFFFPSHLPFENYGREGLQPLGREDHNL